MKHLIAFPVQRALLLIFLSTVSVQLHSQDIIADYQKFLSAFNEKKYERCIQWGEPLVSSTDHPNIQYKLAESYCEIGEKVKCLDLLGILAKRGLPYKIEDNKAFSRLNGDLQYARYLEAFQKNRAVVDSSTTSFVVNDSLLIPEGITYDSVHKTFFIGSLAKSKVIRCAGNGDCTDFSTGDQHGFWMVVGMKVSPDNKSLWICSASERPNSNGYAGIFNFEIPSGKLIRKYVMDNKAGPHLFNDIVFTRQGTIYFTDSKGGKVWRILPGSDALSEYAKGFVYPNGIAADEEGQKLFVADFTGLHVLDLVTGMRTQIRTQGKTYLNQIDGLYFYKGSLIGIQDSGNQDDRVVRFYYDFRKNLITKVRTLQSFRKDFIFPTTGTIIDGELHYIANAQLRNLQPDGSLSNPEKLVNPVILKLKLD